MILQNSATAHAFSFLDV